MTGLFPPKFSCGILNDLIKKHPIIRYQIKQACPSLITANRPLLVPPTSCPAAIPPRPESSSPECPMVTTSLRAALQPHHLHPEPRQDPLPVSKEGQTPLRNISAMPTHETIIYKEEGRLLIPDETLCQRPSESGVRN